MFSKNNEVFDTLRPQCLIRGRSVDYKYTVMWILGLIVRLMMSQGD